MELAFGPWGPGVITGDPAVIAAAKTGAARRGFGDAMDASQRAIASGLLSFRPGRFWVFAWNSAKV